MAKRNIAHPEKVLAPELWAAIQGNPVETEYYKDSQFDDLVGNLFTIGHSNNWLPEAHAVRLLEGYDAKNEPDLWLEFFYASSKFYMGSEAGSRIYFAWHMIPCLAVYRWAVTHKNDKLKAAAADWFTWTIAWWTVVNTGEDFLWLGQRSAGHPPFLRWLDAFGRIVVRGEKKAPSYKADLSWEDLALARPPFKDALLELSDPIRTGGRAFAIKTLRRMNWHTHSAFHVYRTNAGLAVWTDRRVHTSTCAVLGAVQLKGHMAAWLPKGCGSRELCRRKGSEVCVLRDGNLYYDSEVYGKQVLPLPGGDPIEYFSFGGADGFKDHLASGTQPTPEPPPEEAPDPTPAPPDAQPPKGTGKWSWTDWL